ncbi:hypothetical protein AB0F91_37695 [Amycolatopsis sp. NPDC023774]|uniref:hypothetical protein n=1 Tax=Amycolatopsis sp. NPDC023774 TaxID=3155015 RepID=UPI0034014ED0
MAERVWSGKDLVRRANRLLVETPLRGRVHRRSERKFRTAFHWHALDQGIGRVYIWPATPRLNGKAERSHRIDAEEFHRLLAGVVLGDLGPFNDELNGMGGLPQLSPRSTAGWATDPYERLLQKIQP